uniref:YkuD domain-containing protein n=1 Tax=Bursaphelenchus xylophilus TaxID=6326 RepID=A0A1I7S9W0_BURXY
MRIKPTLAFLVLYTSCCVNLHGVSASRRPKIIIDESQLDVNRSIVVGGERIFVPKHLPKLSRAEKYALLRKEGIDPFARKRRTVKKNRRSLLELNALSETPWKIQNTASKGVDLLPLKTPLLSADPHNCPEHFDAITEGHNHRTYIFAGEYVYQIWREDGLQQRAGYKISDLFLDGPRRVTAAMTNLKSGVTVLFDYRKVYRFRWSEKVKRFRPARNSPQNLNEKIKFVPRLAFQWKDGNIIISDGQRFVTYDPYWNVATFEGNITDYFPNIPRDAIGLAHNGRSTFLLLTWHNGLQVSRSCK